MSDISQLTTACVVISGLAGSAALMVSSLSTPTAAASCCSAAESSHLPNLTVLCTGELHRMTVCIAI